MKYLTLFILSLALIKADEPIKMPSYTVTSSATGELTVNNVGDSVSLDNNTLTSTPRTVSQVSSEIIKDFNLTKIEQLSSFASDVQTPGSYGHIATINVRGDLAEEYLNGQRRTDNAFGFQPSFNGVESVDIIHGAAPVVFGPGFYSGGYVNFQTKQASQVSQDSIMLLIGDLTSTHSYLNTTIQVDTNRPINNDSAIRISYEATKDDTFYNYGRDDSQDVYITYNNGNLNINTEFSWQAAPQVEGVNRVTQNLLWHEQYLTGNSNPLDPSSIPSGPTVKLRANDALISSGDFSNADVWMNQIIYTKNLGDSTILKSYTLNEYVDRRRFNEFSYAEYARQYTADQRLELHTNTGHIYQIIGVEARYEWRESETNFNNAYFNGFDIHNTVNHDAANLAGFMAGYPGLNNQLFFGPEEYNADTTDSKVFSISPFIQQRIKLNKLQLLYGARADGYRAFVSDPLQHLVSDDVTTGSTSYNASLIYNFTPNLSIYTTYQHSHAINGTVSGGGIVLDPNLKINKQDFRSLNKLYEAGIRYQNDNTSLVLTGFWQYRQQHDFYYDDADNIMVRGVEAELKHEMGRFFILTNITYNEANFDNSLPFEFNGIGMPAATIAGNYRVPGISRLSANQTFGYKWRHFGASLSARAQSSQTGDTLGNYHIPSQYDLDSQISYRNSNYSITLSVYNMTNRINWIHNGDEYGDNVVIMRESPIHATLAIRYSK